jgi:hypothetical protein
MPNFTTADIGDFGLKPSDWWTFRANVDFTTADIADFCFKKSDWWKFGGLSCYKPMK